MCEIPNKLLKRFTSGKQGCMRLEFSPNGKFLAATCTLESDKTIIKIFDMLTFE